MDINKMAEKIAVAVLDFDPYCGMWLEELKEVYTERLHEDPAAVVEAIRDYASCDEDNEDGDPENCERLLQIADEIESQIDRFAITEDDKRLMMIIMHELLQLNSRDLLQMYGSLTIDEIHALHSKLEHEDFCKRHGIAWWEDMTADDYEQEYREKWDS